MIRIDLVTVFHNDANLALTRELRRAISLHEPDGGYRFIAVDNRRTNRGFALACNLGALHPDVNAPIIGFLNPDVSIDGPFFDPVEATINDKTVITGCRFDKSQDELRIWGLSDWVCGAAFFVQRRWFTAAGGFDQQFVWSWEETDLCRRAESQGLRVKSIDLPIRHTSPLVDSEKDSHYKRANFTRGSQRYYRKWGR